MFWRLRITDPELILHVHGKDIEKKESVTHWPSLEQAMDHVVERCVKVLQSDLDIALDDKDQSTDYSAYGGRQNSIDMYERRLNELRSEDSYTRSMTATLLCTAWDVGITVKEVPVYNIDVEKGGAYEHEQETEAQGTSGSTS